MFGYGREELIGLPVESLVPSGERTAHQRYRTGYQRALQPRPMAERSRLVGLRKDGATLPVEISLSPVPTASENFVLAVIRDAAEPRRRTDLADLARDAVADQGGKDLLDRVVHRLFQVGLSLQAASGLPGDVARRRLADALDQLDDVISGDQGLRLRQRLGSVSNGLVGELNRHPGQEGTDGRLGDPVQYRPVERLA